MRSNARGRLSCPLAKRRARAHSLSLSLSLDVTLLLLLRCLLLATAEDRFVSRTLSLLTPAVLSLSRAVAQVLLPRAPLGSIHAPRRGCSRLSSEERTSGLRWAGRTAQRTNVSINLMDALFDNELGMLTTDGLDVDGCRVGWTSSELPDDMYSASHFALITAYHDIKNRLSGLEHENCSLKRKLKLYELKFPMINDFSQDRNSIFEAKETSLLKSENSNLQQQINELKHELQKSKEREEQLEDVIQAYEKIHMEKSNLQRDLDKMTTLAEKHVERIRSLEQMVRQRDSTLQGLNAKLRSKEVQYLQLHASPDISQLLDCPALTLQSSRSLDTLTDLKLQRLEAELEGARCEVQGACQREEELKGECNRLREELRLLQEEQRQQKLAVPCDRCDVEWIKKVGDEQVNLALAYTELTEELCRLQSLSSKQTEILRQLSQEQSNSVQRHSPVPQRHSPVPHRHSPVPQRRSPVPQRLSPDIHQRSLVPDSSDGPASYAARPSSQHLRATFQGRRSYSEVSDPATYQRPSRLSIDPVSTLPKPRQYGDSYVKKQQQNGSSSVTSSPRHLRDPFPLELPHLCFEKPTPPPPPAQSSEDEEDWDAPSSATPHPLGTTGLRVPSPCTVFPIPSPPATLSCHPSGYLLTDHAQSWPSINLWMETEDSGIRSCPLCQLTFPVTYPDDALIKHIDTHLENSKI
ncbi:TANK-binding kinase 1-binding protein 1 [Erpetoichthys calabaricus]|nr:TANK-binding kinase 1-binding protein 1 [Erpetoichthys calabaricus]